LDFYWNLFSIWIPLISIKMKFGNFDAWLVLAVASWLLQEQIINSPHPTHKTLVWRLIGKIKVYIMSESLCTSSTYPLSFLRSKLFVTSARIKSQIKASWTRIKFNLKDMKHDVNENWLQSNLTRIKIVAVINFYSHSTAICVHSYKVNTYENMKQLFFVHGMLFWLN
jgi:hypothetical protein